MIGAIRPGVTHEDVHDLGTEWMTEHGCAPHAYFQGFWSTCGHQLGLAHEGPYLATGETEPIQVGQALAVEIVVGTPETGGISHEDCVIVTPEGTELITGLQKELCGMDPKRVG